MLITQRCVNKVSRPILLLLFFSLSFEFYLPIFFDCLFVNVYQHYPSWMSGYQCPQSKGVFFTWNFTCNLTSWLELLFSQIRNSITVWCFPFCFFFRRDCVHKSFNFYYTSKASENFRNVQELWKQHFVSCNRLCQGFQRHLDMYANVWEITVFVWEANVK